MTLYEVLEVSEGASKETLNAAYKSLAKRFHPDVCSTPQAQERMKLITEAYSVLSDDEKRKGYDAQLKEVRGGSSKQQHHAANPSNHQTKAPVAGQGVFVEDLALGLFEEFALPYLPPVAVAAYPLARKDLRDLLSMGVERMVRQ